MSGGRLVVLDRRGRDVKVFPLAEGLATIGSDPGCDIRLLLPTVSPHHATVVVHANQTVVSSVTAGDTLVNGVGVSVCALRHGDRLAVGGRALRWEYEQPPAPPMSLPAVVPGAPGRKRIRGTRRPLGVPQRASMPASTSAVGKQVAIVQPQRRQTTNEQNEWNQASAASASASASAARPRSGRHSELEPAAEEDQSHRKSVFRASPRPASTRASLWMVSRRSEPRARSTPLRLAVLRRAQSARRVTKIQAPAIDHTKQAAIMLMAGHTPKPKPPAPKQRPSFVVKRPSPAKGKGRGSNISGVSPLGVTPRRASARAAARGSELGAGDTSMKSPILPEPKKSALKNSFTKKSTRKTESIKFDLSNLENPEDRPSDVVILMDTTKDRSCDSASDEDLMLHFSDTSRSPSPRRSIHSRSSRILEKSLGKTNIHGASNRSISCPSPRHRRSPNHSELESPRHRKSSRGSIIVEKALESSFDDSQYSRGTAKSLTDQSYITTVASTRKTMTRGQSATNQNLESYSIVDLVSMDSTGTDRSVYGSAGSESSAAPYATPRAARSTRANNSSLLSSSTPYPDKTQVSNPVSPVLSIRSRNSSLQDSIRSKNSTLSKRSSSLTTPENAQTRFTLNSTRISRASRSRSRINDSAVLLMDKDDASPKSSRRISKSSLASPRKSTKTTDTPEAVPTGTSTPENRYSPEEATTPMLSIQNLLEQSSLSQSSLTSQISQRRRGGVNLKRKTIGGDRPQSKKFRTSIKSKSLIATTRRSLRARKTSMDHSQDLSQDDEDMTTPKSAVKPIQEGVKNKHSSAKKPLSKRSIIDNLDESDFVKQLFNSPVKRKLSRSMTEFSRKKLFEDDDEVRIQSRNTIAVMDRTPDSSIMERTEAYTPDLFISPLSSPGNSPSKTSEDLRNDKGAKDLKTPRTRRSIKNDLTDVMGVKQIFARSPRNRLSDVRVKEVFALSPENDLRRVSGVKALFRSARKQKSPKNTLQDVRGVKGLFMNTVSDDLRNVSGVKTVLRIKSPRNDLSDVRGVKGLYRETVDKNNLSEVSGVDELFRESESLDTTFDQLIGKPPVRSYTKSKSFAKVDKPKQKRNAKSLHDSISLINENVEEWLDKELKKCVRKDDRKSTSKSNLTRELQKLTTDTVQGNSPMLLSRSRNGTMTRSTNSDYSQSKKSASEIYSIHMLPIKKRSLVEATRQSNVQRLPIKKRVVVHSTPVKGRPNAAMNASELGRVSPIANLMPVATDDITTSRLSQREVSNLIRGKFSLIDDQKVVTLLQLSPVRKKPSPKRPSPKIPSPQVTRVSKASNRNKRRASLVITKKKPVLSPKPNVDTPKSPRNNKNVEVIQKRNRSVRQTQSKDKLITPKQTRSKKAIGEGTQKQDPGKVKEKDRSIRRQSQILEVPKALKNTRAKANKNTVVVTKPSTQLKPAQSTLITKNVNEQEVKTTGKTRRKQDTETKDSTIETTQTRRTRNTKNTEAKITVEKPKEKSTNQNITEEIQKVPEPKTRRGRNVKNDPVSKKETASKPANKIEDQSGKRKERNISSNVNEETKSRRGQNSKTVTFKDEPLPKRRSKIVPNEENKSRVKRGKKNVEDVVEESKTTRKTAVKRGNNPVVEKTENVSNTTIGRRTRAVQNVKTENTVKRGKKPIPDGEKIVKNTDNADKTTKAGAAARRGKNLVADKTEKDSNTTIGRRMKTAQSDTTEKTVKRGKKTVPQDDIDETTVGRRTRNVKKSDDTVKVDKKKVVEDVDTSRGRRKKYVAEKEVPVENTKGRKKEPVKEAPKRRGRQKKVDEEKPTGKDAEPQETSKPSRRKRKVDVDETTIKEAPAKRFRATRAAAPVEPAAAGRSRSRRV